MWKTMKVLVTGGSGFIGKYVLHELQEHKVQTTNWDKIDGYNIFNQIKLPASTEAIIHLVAQLEILNVNPFPELILNVEGTLHMLELARKFDVGKFVFISTADVYGEPIQMPSSEKHPLNPFWSYAASKVAAETYVRQYEELYGIRTVIIRPSIVTGIGEWYGRFITLNMARMRNGEPILVFGNGCQRRDFVAVEDVAHLICLATTQNFTTPEIFNAGSGITTRIVDVARCLQKLSLSKVEFCNPKVGELGRKPHEQINQYLDIEHVRNILGWKPTWVLRTLLFDELRWIKNMDDKTFEEWIRHPRY